MTANPWDKWFWADWENDPSLKLCSLAAQGLWMRMLCITAKSTPKGYMKVADHECDDEEIAQLVGRPIEEVHPLLAELEQWGVFSRTRRGTIYNRRMIREGKKAEIARKNGKLGGNPSLCKKTHIPPSDNQDLNPGLKARSGNNHKPEAISQIEVGGGGSARDTDRETLARSIVDRFETLRTELWPNESGLPAPRLTLQAQALAYLDLGATVPVDETAAVVTETMERGMRQSLAQGKRPTVSLLAFKNSIPDAIASHRAGTDITEGKPHGAAYRNGFAALLASGKFDQAG